MVIADVKFSWVASPSTDVVSQTAKLAKASGEVVVEQVLDVSVTEVTLVGLEQKTDYVFTVTVTDGTQDAASSIQLNLGDLEAPLPVSDIKYSVLNVYNVE
jgi:hypothetical protein